MDDAAQIRSAVASVGVRLRLAALLAHAVRALPIAVLAEAVGLYAWRMRWMTAHAVVIVSIGAVALLATYLMMRARPIPLIDAAHRADVALSAHDRLTSALTFLDDGATSALHRAAIGDGARVAAALDPSQIVALRVPRLALLTPLACALLGLALLAHPRQPTPRPTQPQSRFIVEPDALAAERLAVRRLAADAKGKDPELSALAAKLDALLAAVDQQKLTRAEAFAQLAQIEAAQKIPVAPPLKPSEELKPALKALSGNKETEKLAEAIKHDDLEQAKAELEKLAQEAERRAAEEPPSKEEKEAQDKLQRALDGASKALQEAQKKADAEREKQMEQLKEEQRQLQKRHDEHPEDQENERKLQRNQRQLEKLEREKQQQAEQRRQLQRLQKEMQQAAEQLRQKMSPEAMKRAAEELGKMEDEIRKLGSGAQGQMQIAEIKEVLRRAGRVESGQSGQGKDGGKQNGQGKNGRGEKLRDFEKRADGKGDTLLLGGDSPGDSTLLMPLPGGPTGESGDSQGDDKGKGGDGDKPGDDKGGNGDGIGDQHDPNMLGDKTKLAAAQKLLHAKGQIGAGPSRSQTILGASEKGFSSRDYHKVYDDYHAVVEEMMSQEGVPPGYRYYIKRYFQLIRPRE